jgi:O-acetyl-ADP-ribose deacetylase (regulator of RNase III)
MKLTFFDTNGALVKAWHEENERWGEPVEVFKGSLEFLVEYHTFDTLVSPANSLGIMDGGIDKAISDAFPQVQARLHRALERHQGYLPVGRAIRVSTGDDRHPHMVCLPTMPWPMPIPAFWVYNSMRALLSGLEVWKESLGTLSASHNVIVPGLGTATGAVPPHVAARVMFLALSHHKDGTVIKDWLEAARFIRSIEEAVSL